MATDNSPPRLKLIVTVGVITVVTLVALNFVLGGYYSHMTDEAQRAKLAPTTGLDEYHKSQGLILAGSKIPIDKAMAQLAKGERDALIAPQQSDDLGPMTGWTKLPKKAPMVPMPGAADAGAPANAGDAPRKGK